MKDGIHSGQDLNTILSQLSISRLHKLASMLCVKDATKMRKADLIERIVQEPKKPEQLREFLLVLDKDAWSLFHAVALTGQAIADETANPYYRLMNYLGFLYSERRGGSSVFYMPKEIRAVYSELRAMGFDQLKERYDLLHTFVQAAINLYGVIDQHEFIELFNHYNKKKTDIEELFPCILRHISTGAPYCLWEDYIVSDDLEENNFECVKLLLAHIGDKPRYTPPHAEFLRYYDFGYYERTPYITCLQNFLVKKFQVKTSDACEIVSEIQYLCSDEAPMQAVFDMLDEYGVLIVEDHVQELIQLIIDVSNNSRRWTDNGHTPSEIRQYSMMKSGEKKIDGNDPCPCGSGKKYKDCCGR